MIKERKNEKKKKLKEEWRISAKVQNQKKMGEKKMRERKGTRKELRGRKKGGRIERE